MKKHVCASSSKLTESREKSALVESDNNSVNTTNQLATNWGSNTWPSSSSDENVSQGDNEREEDTNSNKSMGTKKSGNRTKGKRLKGRPTGAARLPRFPLIRRNIGTNDCPDCGETYPNKEILKLHTCKSYLGLETENIYRTDRKNVELISRSTQRRSLEESPPVSPGRSNRKKRVHNTGNSNRSRSRSSSKGSGSKGSTTSVDVDNEHNENSLMSNSDEGEYRSSCIDDPTNNFEKEPVKIVLQHNAILTPINYEHIKESDDLDGTQNLVEKAIDSLENEMTETAPFNYTSPVSSSYTKVTISTTMGISSTDPHLNDTPSKSSSSYKYSNQMQQNRFPGIPVDPNICDKYSTPEHKKKNVREESVNCEQCGKPFSDQNLLTDHILEEHDSDPFD